MVKREIKEERGIDMLGVGRGFREGHTGAEFTEGASRVHGWDGGPG